jgi:hypothetical protein
MSRKVSIALVHYPVLDAQGSAVVTAITNLDVHDLARSARTYGCERYYLVHPILAQRELVEKILMHWLEGSSGKRIPDRKEALSRVEAVPALEDVLREMGGREAVEVWVTAAREVGPRLDLARARARLAEGGKRVLIVFGTGWGLAPAVIAGADATLAPIRAAAPTGYNHLSVRAACAITLDRLLGGA